MPFIRRAARLASATAMLAALALVLLIPGVSQTAAQDAPGAVFSDTEEKAIGEIVRSYLLANPQLMLEVLEELEAYEDGIEKERQAEAIAANYEALFRDSHSFVAGNPDGAITVIEFFDYRCPYCQQTADDIQTLIDTHEDVRLVLKEFPILGPDSTIASQAAIAAIPQGKYLEFHFAMLRSEGNLDLDEVMDIAADVGLNVRQLARDMDTARVSTIIETNRNLAFEVGVRGTPAFIIGDELLPGAASLEALEARLDAVRQERKATEEEAG